MEETNQKFDKIIDSCKTIFLNKTKDYGTSWRVLRTISVVDQIYIKAYRIKTIQEKKTQKISDNIQDEFKGIINYAVIGLIQLQLNNPTIEELNIDLVNDLYDEQIKNVFTLMQNKNHDYGEAWKDMDQKSFTDLIIVKLLRAKQIIANDGKTIASEGIPANFFDIINYSIFALILSKS